jgi:hypothetical protein
VPSDFGKALEGFTRMLGAPGEDGVFRFQPSPVDDAPAARPEDDDESVREWFDTATDPALAKVVADAEAQARRAVAPPGMPEAPPAAVSAAAWPSPGQLPPAPEPRPHGATAQPIQAAPPTEPTTPTMPIRPNGEPESAQPTPPRGMPRSPEPDENGGGGNGRAGAADGPARPGYPSPPPRS